MSSVITRFAPSPTGLLHVGNTRTALINYFYARKYGGKFILRIDDTDLKRNKKEYQEAIYNDLSWLGIEWDESFNQLSRLARYLEAKEKLIESGRLYPCYETNEELELKRKQQLADNLPPVYDRTALTLTKKQITDYEQEGRQPYYRFLINKTEKISWSDMIKGTIEYQANYLNDPIVIRADGSVIYLFCSVIDDIDYNITDIIRGEDHLSNTAIQIQLFNAFGATMPNFAHLSLIKAKDEKISKREGGFAISTLRDQDNIEAMAVNSFFTFIGSSIPVRPYKTNSEIITDFAINSYSKSPTTYVPKELALLNQKLIIHYEYKDVKDRLSAIGLEKLDEQFWLAVRPNLQKFTDIKQWWQIYHYPDKITDLDQNLLQIAADSLPVQINDSSYLAWIKLIATRSGKKGKALFLPIRLALTGKESGPELKDILLLLGREEILKRLSGT